MLWFPLWDIQQGKIFHVCYWAKIIFDRTYICSYISQVKALISSAFLNLVEHAFVSIVATPLWSKCEYETHTPQSGNLESSGTPKISQFKCKGQNISSWSVFYTVGKVSKCRCPKWPRMDHLDCNSCSCFIFCISITSTQEELTGTRTYFHTSLNHWKDTHLYTSKNVTMEIW